MIDIYNEFRRNKSFLRNISDFLLTNPDLKDKIILNSKLAASSNRVEKPTPFTPFIKIAESNGFKVGGDLAIKMEDIRESDANSFKMFGIGHSSHKQLNSDTLLKAAILSCKDLGLIKQDGSKFKKMPIVECANRYPQTTSSSYPDYKPKGSEPAKTNAIQWATDFLSRPNITKILSQPCTVFHRFQYKMKEGETEVTKKIRQVWGVPYSVLLVEAYFFRDVLDSCIEFQMKLKLPSAPWGRTLVQLSESIISHVYRKEKPIIIVDVTAFDQTVSPWLWALFYAIMSKQITFENRREKLVFDSLMAYHNFTPYCYGDTKLRFQQRGVPSGSLITNTFDTFVTRTIINYAFLESTGGQFGAGTNSFCLGDDNLIILDGLTRAKMLNVYKRFGFTITESKSEYQYKPDNFTFLGYIWDKEKRPWQKDSWYLAHFCFPSRFYRSPEIPVDELQTYRAISIAAPLYKGMDAFRRIIGTKDHIYANLLKQYQRGEQVTIKYVGKNERFMYMVIPLYLILNYGWKFYSIDPTLSNKLYNEVDRIL